MNNINLSNAIEALKHALKAHDEAERAIGLAMQQINVADTEAVDPETIAVEVHDNAEYQRGRQDAFKQIAEFISKHRVNLDNWDINSPLDILERLENEIHEECPNEQMNIYLNTMQHYDRPPVNPFEGVPAKRFPWEITQAGL